MNHLKGQKSPYLRQHVHNPVDWYPWTEEAFNKAKQENKPIFLSIGYSTCHWCHVMEKESFEDQNIAKILNENFISIKVDREERPDIDSIYMMVCQIMNGQGGWPLNLFLTPDKEPFFSGTYFPKENKYGRIGFSELLKRVQDLWKNKNTDVQKTAQTIISALKEMSEQVQKTKTPIEEILKYSEECFVQEFDTSFGGFGGAPKFPNGHKYFFLMALYSQTKNKDLLDMIEYSLLHIHQGGIYDHVGGGIHRYSTDEKWILPHFEKMLYDQALIAMCYVQAFQITKNIIYKKIACEIFEFLNRELKNEEAGYCSAYDADSEGVEGKFYTWTLEELKALLTVKEMGWVEKAFIFHEYEGQHVLYLKESFYKKTNDEVEAYYKLWEPIQQKLYKARAKRVWPIKDNKILTDWNGLILTAMLMGAKAFQDAELKQNALDSLDFLTTNDFKHSRCEGEISNEIFLDDYANIIWACIEAYEVTADEKHLKKIKELLKELEFFEDTDGSYFFTSKASETILLRNKESYDGATPSGNAIMLYNLTKLSRIFKNEELVKKVESFTQSYLGSISQSPTAFSFWLVSLLWQHYSDSQNILVFKESDTNFLNLKKSLETKYDPLAVNIFKNVSQKSFLNYLKDYEHKSLATLYKCQAFICRKPTTEVLE